MVMHPVAMAVRWVAGLAPTSTMWAWPWASKWVMGEVLDMAGCEGLRNMGRGKASYGHVPGLPLVVRPASGARDRRDRLQAKMAFKAYW